MFNFAWGSCIPSSVSGWPGVLVVPFWLEFRMMNVETSLQMAIAFQMEAECFCLGFISGCSPKLLKMVGLLKRRVTTHNWFVSMALMIQQHQASESSVTIALVEPVCRMQEESQIADDGKEMPGPKWAMRSAVVLWSGPRYCFIVGFVWKWGTPTFHCLSHHHLPMFWWPFLGIPPFSDTQLITFLDHT